MRIVMERNVTFGINATSEQRVFVNVLVAIISAQIQTLPIVELVGIASWALACIPVAELRNAAVHIGVRERHSLTVDGKGAGHNGQAGGKDREKAHDGSERRVAKDDGDCV